MITLNIVIFILILWGVATLGFVFGIVIMACFAFAGERNHK